MYLIVDMPIVDGRGTSIVDAQSSRDQHQEGALLNTYTNIMHANRSAAVIAAAACIGAISTIAQGGIAHFEDPGIFSPIENGQVQVIWVGSNAGYTGELSLFESGLINSITPIWTNKSATTGQSYTIPRLYSQGERVDFNYEVIAGGLDLFSTANQNDWSQFIVDDSDPFDVLVGVEDIRYPRGDMDHNDSVFRVVFTAAQVPGPGSFALLGGGCLMMLRRRR